MFTRILSVIFAVFFLASSYAHAEPLASESSRKLDKILETQKQILQQIEEIKQELYVIKIRATQQ